MRIQVTQKHIDEGMENDCFRCPVALAFLDAGFFRPDVHGNCVWLVGVGSFDLSDTVETWIQDFDEGYPVQPFAFEVEGLA